MSSQARRPHGSFCARPRAPPPPCVLFVCYVLCAVCCVLCVMCLSKVAQNAVFVLLTMCLRLCCVMWHHVLCAFGCASTVCNNLTEEAAFNLVTSGPSGYRTAANRWILLDTPPNASAWPRQEGGRYVV